MSQRQIGHINIPIVIMDEGTEAGSVCLTEATIHVPGEIAHEMRTILLGAAKLLIEYAERHEDIKLLRTERSLPIRGPFDGKSN